MNRLAKADGLLKAAIMYEPSDLLRAGWYEEVREYIDGLQSVETVLADLVEQIAITDPTYGKGYRLRSSPAFRTARKLVLRWQKQTEKLKPRRKTTRRGTRVPLGFHGPEPLLREPARAIIEIRTRGFG
jgi:hypothetical protein